MSLGCFWYEVGVFLAGSWRVSGAKLACFWCEVGETRLKPDRAAVRKGPWRRCAGTGRIDVALGDAWFLSARRSASSNVEPS